MTKQSYIELSIEDLKRILEKECGEPIKNIEVVTRENETISVMQLKAQVDRIRSKQH